jgi:hypothetical protein
VEKQTKAQNKPVSDHEWTVHSLNIHGIFFERWCKHVIENSPQWYVRATQYPVAFSPQAGPLHKVGGHESALDIRAELSYRDDRLLNLLIECKKNNPEFIEWMFFPTSKPSTDDHLIIPAVSCPTARKDVQHHILRPMLKDLYLGVPVADESRETRGDYQSIKADRKTKTANDSISSAAHQVALATQAIFLEEASSNLPEKPIKGAKKLRVEKQIFIPAIVTTARLYLCEFDPADISPTEGVIPFDKVSMIEKPYLIYKYPLPVHLQMDRGHILYLSSSNKLESLVRMHIFVVNSAHFSEFLTFLKERFTNLFWDMNGTD